MKTTTRSRRSLPSPLKVSFYLLAVTAFCIVNWVLLAAGDPVQHDAQSFESIVVKGMLEELPPVKIPEAKPPASEALNLNAASEIALGLETWMINYQTFTPVDADSGPALEDWMISTSGWSSY
jgi:hypothetical protein